MLMVKNMGNEKTRVTLQRTEVIVTPCSSSIHVPIVPLFMSDLNVLMFLFRQFNFFPQKRSCADWRIM